MQCLFHFSYTLERCYRDTPLQCSCQAGNAIETPVMFCYKFFMATEKPRILVTVDEDLLQEIDDYRFGNRIKTQSEAVRQLLLKGLEKVKKDASKK